MNKLVGGATLLFGLALSGCSSEPAAGPTEQIIVREPGAPAPVTVAAESAIAKGKSAFSTCATCHAIEATSTNTVGPNLHAVIGRAAGSAEGFAYSKALQDSGITWTEEELDSFIANPAAKIPGTTMVAGAVGDAETRSSIISYLKSVGN